MDAGFGSFSGKQNSAFELEVSLVNCIILDR